MVRSIVSYIQRKISVIIDLLIIYCWPDLWKIVGAGILISSMMGIWLTYWLDVPNPLRTIMIWGFIFVLSAGAGITDHLRKK